MDESIQNGNFFFGYREYQGDFVKRFSKFLNLLGDLNSLFFKVDEKARPNESHSGLEYAVFYFLYREIIEEFNAILILCSNGFSRGAMILLRSMYEHCTTLIFFQKGYSGELDLKGDTIQRFIEYGHVSRRKIFRSLKDAYKGDLIPSDFKHIEEQFLEVKDTFMIEDCSKCQSTKLAFRWSKHDIVSMAKAAGLPKELSFFCYSQPISYAHPSADYIEKRVERDEDGRWSYVFESEQDERSTLMNSHWMSLIASEAFLLYCGVREAESLIKPHSELYLTCWNDSSAPQSKPPTPPTP